MNLLLVVCYIGSFQTINIKMGCQFNKESKQELCPFMLLNILEITDIFFSMEQQSR